MKYYVGLSLSFGSSIDSGLVVMQENGDIILIDKLYKMNDVIYFFENFSSLKNSEICVSLPWDRTMLEGKWRILSKPYQMVATNPHMPNQNNWTQRYAHRGCEYFNSLSEQGIPITRFELYLTRQSMHLNSCFKERSPADCKFLQNILKNEYNFEDIPTNMMPAGALEAVVGALVAREYSKGNTEPVSEFAGVDVINVK